MPGPAIAGERSEEAGTVPDHPPPGARRRAIPDRLLLPPAPREPELAARWEALPFERRRRLAQLSLRDASPIGTDEARLVAGLARARVATAWRLQAAALIWGWLVLMTVWGFGRSSFPDHERSWLVSGLLVGGLVWVAAALSARRRVARARAVAASAGSGAPRP